MKRKSNHRTDERYLQEWDEMVNEEKRENQRALLRYEDERAVAHVRRSEPNYTRKEDK